MKYNFAKKASLITFFWFIKIVGNGSTVQFNNLEQLYDFWAPHYEELVAKTHYIVSDWLIANIDLMPNQKQRVLDLGCADGMVGELIHQFKPNYIFTGIDFSKKMVEKCSQKRMYSHVIHTDLNDGLPVDVWGQKYDLVLATGCLEFIQHHEDLLREINRRMKNGGQFWLTLQAEHSCDPEFVFGKQLMTYTEDHARELMNASGFEIISLWLVKNGYVESTSKIGVPYLLIIAKKP